MGRFTVSEVVLEDMSASDVEPNPEVADGRSGTGVVMLGTIS